MGIGEETSIVTCGMRRWRSYAGVAESQVSIQLRCLRRAEISASALPIFDFSGSGTRGEFRAVT